MHIAGQNAAPPHVVHSCFRSVSDIEGCLSNCLAAPIEKPMSYRIRQLTQISDILYSLRDGQCLTGIIQISILILIHLHVSSFIASCYILRWAYNNCISHIFRMFTLIINTHYHTKCTCTLKMVMHITNDHNIISALFANPTTNWEWKLLTWYFTI